MSRIGKQPVKIPSETTVTKEGNKITVKGPKGELSVNIHKRIEIDITEENIIVQRKSDEKFDRSLHGLSRSLLQNMVDGVNKEFEKTLEINGVGYKVQVKGKMLTLNVGFSYPIEYKIPEGITIEIDEDKKNIFKVSGIDKQKVGQVAAKIRSFRKPEPYKGKGIKYLEEQIKRKAGKTAASASEN